MNAFDIFQGIVSLWALMLGVAVVYLLAKGGWLLVLRGLQAIGRFVRGLFHNLHQAVVDVPFLIQLLLLPFLLAWEQVHNHTQVSVPSPSLGISASTGMTFSTMKNASRRTSSFCTGA